MSIMKIASHAFLTSLLVTLFVTLPATAIGARAFDALSWHPFNHRCAFLTIMIWEVLVVFIVVASEEVGLSWQLNQIGSSIFGPHELYGFQNLFAYRIIAWSIATTPVAWTSLWVYSRLTWFSAANAANLNSVAGQS